MNKQYLYVIEGFEPVINGFGGEFDFHVYLDRDFARKAKLARIGVEAQRDFQKVGEDLLRGAGESGVKTPYIFYEDSFLVTEFVINGSLGRCLNTNVANVESLDKKVADDNFIGYHTSNLGSSRDACALLALFFKWVSYGDVVLDGK